jgi:hypothetical protein
MCCDFAENYSLYYKMKHRDSIRIMPMQLFTAVVRGPKRVGFYLVTRRWK